MTQLVGRNALVAALAAALFACANREQLAIDLKRATSANNLPKVVACYERVFEAAGFRGEHEALVSFTIAKETGNIRDARVDKLSGDSAEGLDRCLVDALNSSSLAGGGLKPSQDVEVSSMRIAFRDNSAEARKTAAETTSNVLLGPRADRCLGLYDHDPPRPAAALFSELSEAQAQAARVERDDPDGHARALQRAYDVSLELRKRLRLDARAEDLPKENRKRIADARAKASDTANVIAKKIGCRVPDE
jgi:hypothetical protein